MGTIKEIEDALSQLPEDQLKQFRAWFDEFDAKNWDDRFERDVKAGKLDALANQALADYRNGKCKERPHPPAPLTPSGTSQGRPQVRGELKRTVVPAFLPPIN